MATGERPTSLATQMFLSSDIPTPPLCLPWGARGIHCHLFYCFQGHKISTTSTTNVSLFWGNPKEEESPLSLSRSTAPVDSHPSSSKKVTQSRSGPLSFSSLLAPTQGGSEFRIVHVGWGTLE